MSFLTGLKSVWAMMGLQWLLGFSDHLGGVVLGLGRVELGPREDIHLLR